MSLNQKVAIYIRVSTHWQVDKDSLQVQRRELIAYSEMILGITDYVVFEDPGYSAKNTDRPAYQAMISRLRSGEFSHLLVWKIDRISRNLLDFTTMYAELKSIGVIFVSKNEQFDTSSAIGEAMLKIILVFAELERNMTSERVSAVMLSRATNGQWNGGRVPFGYSYDKDTKQFSVREDEAKTVRLIFRMYDNHKSTVQIAKHLNESGIRTRKGAAWSVVVMHEILTNPFYIGSYRYNRFKDGRRSQKRDSNEWVIVQNHHDPIVDEALFDRVQSKLARNKRGGNRKGETRSRKNTHIFAGLLECGICGNNMSATLTRERASGVRPSIYGCSSRRSSPDTCSNKYVSDITILQFVLQFISNTMKLVKSSSRLSSTKQVESRLLSGEPFAQVRHIDDNSLKTIAGFLENGVSGFEYLPKIGEVESDLSARIELLQDKRRKDSIALERLKSLYLYSESSLPEKDFVLARQKLIDEMNDIDKQLLGLDPVESVVRAKEADFIAKASYYIMADKLMGPRQINAETLMKNVERETLRNFVVTLVDRIVVKDGMIISIRFKNGLEPHFDYK